MQLMVDMERNPNAPQSLPTEWVGYRNPRSNKTHPGLLCQENFHTVSSILANCMQNLTLTASGYGLPLDRKCDFNAVIFTIQFNRTLLPSAAAADVCEVVEVDDFVLLPKTAPETASGFEVIGNAYKLTPIQNTPGFDKTGKPMKALVEKVVKIAESCRTQLANLVPQQQTNLIVTTTTNFFNSSPSITMTVMITPIQPH